ncbi:ribosomal protein P0 (A0) (L10E) [Podila horticola]|nr:ribosomal protein P0 (A0) (L10E) [Podila horticola]
MSKAGKKEEYFQKLKAYLEEYPSIFIVNVDNVGSNQMHEIRKALRGDAKILMGKNTMVRRAIRILQVENPNYEKLMPSVRGNIGFVFTNCDLKTIRDKVLTNRVKAPAKAGALAPIDVYDNGTVFHPSVLDIEEDALISQFVAGIKNIAAISLQIGYPTVASVPHSIINSYKNLLAVSIATEYTFPGAEKIKAYLADPSAFAVAAPVAAAAATAEKVVEKVEEKEESDDDMGFGLFD